MHVRFSTCRGMPVLEDGSDDVLGTLESLYVHPDTGKVEGFFVRLPSMFRSDELFLSSMDILHWGTYVRVNDADALSPLEERVRLQALWESGRTVYGQQIMTETGKVLGTCADIQFDTRLFQAEWLFPRRWFRWGLALPVTEIIEVRSDAIIVRDSVLPVTEPPEGGGLLKTLDELTDVTRPAPTPGVRRVKNH